MRAAASRNSRRRARLIRVGFFVFRRNLTQPNPILLMTTLAPPPPTNQPPPLELPAVSFLGRSLAEYAQVFALDVAAWRGRDVLDVAAGPSSFVAEACARRVDAVAIDPLYGSPVDALAVQVEADHGQLRARSRTGARVPPLFRSNAATEADRRAAAQRFLDDYATHYLHGRYVGGALPRLPFFDGTFDLVLCAHLLFSEATRFDFDWHVSACRELVRVSAGDVRIYPVCSADRKPYPGLPRLRRELRAAGIASELAAGDGESSMLVLRRNPA